MPTSCIGCEAPLENGKSICPNCGAQIMVGVWTVDDGVQLEDRIWEGLKTAGRKSQHCVHLFPYVS